MKTLISFRPGLFCFTTLPLILLLVVPFHSEAQNSNSFITAQDIDADIVPRLVHEEAAYAMTTREGSVDLMITDKAIVIQFSDKFLKNMEDEILEAENMEYTSHFEATIRAMVSKGVTTLLDRALAVPLYEIEEIYYESGKLHIINWEGDDIFEDLEVDDHMVMEDFSRRDIGRFISEAEKRMI